MGIRFDQHVNGTKSLLSQAIKEYGLMNFDFYLISILPGSSKAERIALESSLIIYLKPE